MDSQWPLQQAIYDVLSAALDCPVYDNVPASATMPYVVIGDDTQVPDDTKTSLGFDDTVTIHVWSNAKDGRREAKQLLGEIYGVLHDAEMSVTGFHAVNCRCEFSQTVPDIDDSLTHGIARYRVMLDKAA